MIFFKKTTGFTLVEVLVSVSIFAVVMILVAQFYGSVFSKSHRSEVELALYQEARDAITLLRDEMGKSTIDYQKYWFFNAADSGEFSAVNTKRDCADNNKDVNVPPSSSDAIKKNYAFQFIDDGANEHLNCTTDAADYDDDPDIGTGAAALSGALASQWNASWKTNISSPAPTSISPPLFLLGETGNTRVWFRLHDGKIEMLRLRGYDSNNDGVNDRWVCEKNFECNGSLSDGSYNGKQQTSIDDGWVAITPDTLEITRFDFRIAPTKNPHLAFNEPEMQVSPHIFLFFSARPSSAVLAKIGINSADAGSPPAPSIDVQTTITARALSEILVFN